MLVLDTCVLLDICLKHRKAHAGAAKLAEHLKRSRTTVVVPMHAFFELTSAFMCEKRMHGGDLTRAGSDVLTESSPLKLVPVPIDINFVEKCATGEAPDLNAGDMIFVVLARAERHGLVTEDGNMLKEARRLGVSAYRISEYLESLAADT